MEVNVVDLFRLARFAVEGMRKAGGGSIVNGASIYAEIGAQKSTGYSASKGAVAALTRQMATDFGPDGIRVNAVTPGLNETPLSAERIRTEQWRHRIFVKQCPVRRVGQPQNVRRRPDSTRDPAGGDCQPRRLRRTGVAGRRRNAA